MEVTAEATQLVTEIFTSLSNPTVSPEAISNGTRLINALTVLLIAWTGIKMTLEFEPAYSAMAGIIRIILLWGFATFMVGDVAGGGLHGIIQSGMKSISTSVLPQSVQGANEFAVMGKMVESAAILFKGPEKIQQGSSSPGNAGEAKGFWDSVRGMLPSEISFSNLMYALLSLLTRWFVAVFVIIAGLLYFGSLLVAQLMFKISAVMMPFMVPWIMLEATSFIFNGWLRFTITSGLQVVVANIIYGMSLGIVDKVISMVSKIPDNPQAEYMVYAAALLITGIMAFVMLQVSSIANGLLSGSAMGSWKPAGKLSPAGGSTASSNVISNAGKSGASAANKTAGAIAGGVSGFRGGGGLKGGIAGGVQGWKDGAGKKISAAMANKLKPNSSVSSAGASGGSSSPAPGVSIRPKIADLKNVRRGG